VSELAQPFAMSLPGVSKHLKVLEAAGLVSKDRDAQWRRCRLEPAPLRDLAAWLDLYRRFLDEGFERLDDYLMELQTPKEPTDVRSR
jgi:DNA-binding transcriptional ArsR family regulator